MNRLAITCVEDGERKFMKYRTVLGSKPTLETVDINKATLFDDPEVVEAILHSFDIPEPRVELMTITHLRTLESKADKYATYASICSESEKLFCMCDDKDDDVEETTKVMFRRVINNPQAGEIIAIFPGTDFDINHNLASYMFVGQHSGCSEQFVIEDTISSKSGCSISGCMEEHLRDIVGYESLEIVDSLEEVGYTPKCLYCDSGDEPTHFICESCGDGMCEECYDSQMEHDSHYQDPADSAPTSAAAEFLEDVFGNGYGCDKCVNKAMKTFNLMEK